MLKLESHVEHKAHFYDKLSEKLIGMAILTNGHFYCAIKFEYLQIMIYRNLTQRVVLINRNKDCRISIHKVFKVVLKSFIFQNFIIFHHKLELPTQIIFYPITKNDKTVAHCASKVTPKIDISKKLTSFP